VSIFRSSLAILTLCMALSTSVAAQTNINLGAINADASAPVEITADNLTVDQDTGVAVFQGNVLVGQGDLRLSAQRLQVIYNEATGKISRLSASGGVTLVTETEAAEAQSADYNLDDETLLMQGDVLLTQGNSAISADSMRVDLATGSAQLEGRVRTILSQGGD